MINILNYIEDGKVNRTNIADDIISNQFTRQDINELISNDTIRAAFFSNKVLQKQDKSYWNEEYLNMLSCMAVSEKFDEEYLLYLFEVTKYYYSIKQKKAFSRKIFLALITILIIFLLILCFTKGK